MPEVNSLEIKIDPIDIEKALMRAVAEIKVTNAMREAGAYVIECHKDLATVELVAELVFEAMARVALIERLNCQTQ